MGDAGTPRSRRTPIVGVLVSASSVQVGAAFGATLFPLVGPFGVAAMRQAVAAVTLLALTRPPLRALGIRRLLPALLLGVVLVGMNTALYGAVERIGLGLAVTVEFLGPLGVALVSARGTRALLPARTRRGAAILDGGAALLALFGIVLISRPFGGPAPDPIGLALGVAAALLWAAYILLNERAGALPGVTGTAVASLVGTLLTLPFLVLILTGLPPAVLPRVLAIGAVTGVLSSALPYSLDLLILRRLPRSLFGLLQSAHPVAAVVFGFLVLAQRPSPLQIAGIAAVCVANTVAVIGARRGAAVIGGGTAD